MGPMFISKRCLLSPIDRSRYLNRLVSGHSGAAPKDQRRLGKGWQWH